MNKHEYSSRPRLFVAISSLVFLTLLLAGCGGSSTSGGAVTPTSGKTGTLQTSCPPKGTARAAVLSPLALGTQNTVVYAESQPPLFHPTSVTLKRYTISTRTTTDIVTLPNTNIYEAQISADGQWVLLHTNVSNQPAMGGQAKTIYSTPTEAITALRVASSTTLLLINRNRNTDTSHNGLWKMNTDGTGLTRLISDVTNEEIRFNSFNQYPWSNVSRDGTFYSITVINPNGPNRLLFGAMNGGAPVTFASGKGEKDFYVVGWTAM